MDLNGDGFKDILSGSYSKGELGGVFQVLYGQKDGSFKRPTPLNGSDNKPLVIRSVLKGLQGEREEICTRPTAVQWDGDGSIDLIVGNSLGTFYIFKGDAKGNFHPKPEQVMRMDKTPLVVRGDSDPFMIDWDGDGDMDLLSGSDLGGVYYAENTAKSGATPEFTGFKTLIKPSDKATCSLTKVGMQPIGPERTFRIWVDDINGDGKLDLLVGDAAVIGHVPKGMTQKEATARQTEWETIRQKRSAEIERVMKEKPGDKKAENQARIHYSANFGKHSEFYVKESTGFVWLYLQK